MLCVMRMTDRSLGNTIEGVPVARIFTSAVRAATASIAAAGFMFVAQSAQAAAAGDAKGYAMTADLGNGVILFHRK